MRSILRETITKDFEVSNKAKIYPEARVFSKSSEDRNNNEILQVHP